VYNSITKISLLIEFYTYPGLISERGNLLKSQGLVARPLVNPRRMADQCHRGMWNGAQNPLSTLALSEKSWESLAGVPAMSKGVYTFTLRSGASTT